MSEIEKVHLTDVYALKTMPYLKYLTQKSGQNKKSNKVVEEMPNNYIDYLLIDAEALRVEELNMFKNEDDTYNLEITVINYEYEISLQYNFLITETLKEIIEGRMEYFFGQPERVTYNLRKARNFKVIKGGKLNGK